VGSGGLLGSESGEAGTVFVGGEGFQNVGQSGLGGDFSGGDQIISAREIVPDERLNVGLDNDVGLRAPGQVGVALDDGERSADNVGGGAGRGEAAGFEVNGNGDVGAEQAGTFDWDGGCQEAIDEGATFELDGDEESRVSAGTAQRRAERAARVVDGDTGVDVGGGDGEGRGELLEGFERSEALEIALEAKIVGEAEPGGRPAAEVSEGGERGDALHVVERDACAVDGADQRTDASAGDAIDGDAGVSESANHADVGDAAGEASGECEADARAISAGARLVASQRLDAVVGVAQPLLGERDLFRDVARVAIAGLVVLIVLIVFVLLVGHPDYSLVRLRIGRSLFDRGMLVL
jgi:hypothetical protein